MLNFSFVSIDEYRRLLTNIFLSIFTDRRLVSRRLIRKLVDSHGSAETRSPPLRRGPATLLM